MATRKTPRKNQAGSRARRKAAAPGDLPGTAAATQVDGHEPPSPPTLFPVVGMGASAGGLDAFVRLLRALPADTGMAFVLVQHLAPDRASSLPEILARATTMPVVEALDGQVLEPDHVYVMPPDWRLTVAKGRLHLHPRVREDLHPIDGFFRSLAESHGRMAVGVVLSGTATDGTLGLEEVKAEGGITFAQDGSAEHGGMPQSAAASGCVDFVLSPEEIAGELARIAAHPLVGTSDGRRMVEPHGKAELLPILRRLRSATGVDFEQYRTSTLSRRISRRMVLAKKHDLRDYERHLREDRGELQALYQDLLINVTRFFRDPEVFETLRDELIPPLLERRSPTDPLRVWVLGCSTGEEAYSMAIILAEAMVATGSTARATIFATDLSEAAVTHARRGVYTRERMVGMSPERLNDFFEPSNGSFRIKKALREMCVFSRHDALADPPFSRLDVISCRNLLIYLEPSSQQRILPILHFALRPSGVLVLGTSETTGPHEALFEPVDVKQKIFVKREGHARLPAFPGPAEAARARDAEPARSPRAEAGLHPLRRIDVDEATDRVLAGFAPPAVLVDANLDVVQVRGDVGPFLTPAQGAASLAVLKMARSGLLVPLRSLLHRARKEQAPMREEAVRVRSGSGEILVDLEVLPIRDASLLQGCYLVLFQQAVPPSRPPAKARRKQPQRAGQETYEGIIAGLEHELANSRKHIHDILEQHDAAKEELQSANEEAQSANEELQSINEELETSKEEIQSANEELITINDELGTRNIELTQLYDDLSNLVDNIGVPVVIIGRDLRIRRSSPKAETVLGLLPTDVGRPLADVAQRSLPSELERLLKSVIETIVPAEREVQGLDRRWYSLHIRPYLTHEGKIEGAVLVLVDIHHVRSSRALAEGIIETLREPLLLLDQQLTVRNANRAFYAAFGLAREDVEGRPLHELGERYWDLPDLLRALRSVATEGTNFQDFSVAREYGLAGFRVMELDARRLVALDEEQEMVLLAMHDVTDRTRLQEGLLASNESLLTAGKAKDRFLAELAHELRSPLNAIRGWTHILQKPDVTERDLRRGLEVIDRCSKAQTRIIEDLLDLRRIATGKIQLELAPVDLGKIVAWEVDSMRPLASEKGIRLEVDGSGPLWVSGDVTRLQQALGNLIGNSLKFTADGGEVRVTLRRSGARAEVRVHDTGQGITKAVLAHVFEGHQMAGQPPGRGEGLGLGLSIARQLVELQGGKVWAKSPGRGRGATFTISLPLLGEVPERAPALTSDGPALPASLEGLTLLVVDDEADARETLRRMLESAGAEVAAVATADEALHSIREDCPDLVLSDIGMPGQDGYELMHSIRALPAPAGSVPAIALTAYALPIDRQRAKAAGFQLHLAKPVDPAALIAAVASLCSRPCSS